MRGVSVGIWVGVGSRHEPVALNGVSHFLEHMLFKGTHRRSSLDISSAIESLGGSLNAFTAEENTCYHARIQSRHLDTALDVLWDMYRHATLPPEEIRKERQVIREEITMYADQPQSQVLEILNEVIWPEQAMGRPITGTHASVNRLRRPQLSGFMDRHYTAPNTLVTCAGAVEHQQVLEWFRAQRRTQGLRSAMPPQAEPTRVPTASPPGVRCVKRPIEQAQLALAFRAFSRLDERRHAIRVLSALLAETMCSRLFQSLREERGLVYSVYSSAGLFQDTGALTLSLGTDPDKLVPALKLTLKELRALVKQAPGIRETRAARDYLIGQFELSQESTDSRMIWLGEQILGGEHPESPEETIQGLMQVRPSDIRKMAADLFRPTTACMALVSPLEERDDWQKMLANL